MLLLLEVTDPVLCEVPADELDDFDPDPDDPEEDVDAMAVPLPIVVGVYWTPFRLAATSKTLPSLTSYYRPGRAYYCQYNILFA